MSTHEQDPSRNNSSAPEQTPHSGVKGFEQPHQEFGSTPLSEAPLAYDPRTTEGNLTTAHLPEELRVPAEKQHTSWKKPIAVVALLAAGVAGAFGASKAMGGGDSSPAVDHREPGTSAPANPGETNAPTQEVESTDMEKYGISAIDNPTFESAVTAYYAKLGEYLASSSDQMDTPGDPKYLNAFLGENWETNDELDDYGTGMQDLSVLVSTSHLATGENGSTEYELNIDVTGVSDVAEQDDEISGTVSFHATDNTMDTVLAMSADKNYEENGQAHITFANVNGYWQIVQYDNLANN